MHKKQNHLRLFLVAWNCSSRILKCQFLITFYIVKNNTLILLLVCSFLKKCHWDIKEIFFFFFVHACGLQRDYPFIYCFKTVLSERFQQQWTGRSVFMVEKLHGNVVLYPGSGHSSPYSGIIMPYSVLQFIYSFMICWTGCIIC